MAVLVVHELTTLRKRAGKPIVHKGMYFQKLKFSVTFDRNAVCTSFFYHTIALEILYPSIYFLCPQLAQNASFEDARPFR